MCESRGRVPIGAHRRAPHCRCALSTLDPTHGSHSSLRTDSHGPARRIALRSGHRDTARFTPTGTFDRAIIGINIFTASWLSGRG